MFTIIIAAKLLILMALLNGQCGVAFVVRNFPTSVMTSRLKSSVTNETIDTRPYNARAQKSRTARRMNHGFRYLYRHFPPTKNMTALEYLKDQGYTSEEVIFMQEQFPPLLELNVRRHLHPKMRFLKETMFQKQDLQKHIRSLIPPQYFGARLEKTVAPRHAFLVHHNLPHGSYLFSTRTTNGSNETMWQEFLMACRNPRNFASLCERWSSDSTLTFSSKQVEAFDVLFGRGLMAAARNESCDGWPSEHLPNITSSDMIPLLIQHGANSQECDHRGVSLLHWAAGCGNLQGLKALIHHSVNNNHTQDNDVVFLETERDGATLLHWAAAGSTARHFGVGGHIEVCQYLLSLCKKMSFINAQTKDGNSALMWAAWSGSLEVVKLLIRNRADSNVVNRNGCTVAHWAASGGNLPVCEYLKNIVGVDFQAPNHGGNTPLTHAVAFSRANIVEWFQQTYETEEDSTAMSLAMDFVEWTNGEDEKRQEVFDLLQQMMSSSK
mmetsp:Transcript_20427/g.30698  ORF Transcript_20427/g.30698 Transcript_20427/m.30698 type:complete len:495 (-) Transcript_20427:160-1644(-)|eukprot:CAMPEP_0178896930 /NCGR_PEP_ID=MMETSP0786-20121207/1459_1 /TAXON_ID=186022 /ORGANISM="Thalassionema frauenfeldii, Strain CCMP 1798" /LENGTH=494 /DNA_ID=CAMNT_0020567413 /DNA_START=66 /DNA_END=1550 /DNA_ORIENTATION=+